jgi:hypothetical protein
MVRFNVPAVSDAMQTDFPAAARISIPRINYQFTTSATLCFFGERPQELTVADPFLFFSSSLDPPDYDKRQGDAP